MHEDSERSSRGWHLTRIVATLGPASSTETGIRELLQAGVDIFRINFSHGSHDEHRKTFERIRKVSSELGVMPAVLQDIPGPKLRMGEFGDESITLEDGDRFRLDTDFGEGDASGVRFESDGWHRSVQAGDRVFLGDGVVQLRVTSTDDSGFDTEVIAGGEIRSRQGLNFPDSDLDLGAVTDEDWDHISFGLELGVDAVALSFVQGPDDLIAVRRFIQRKNTRPLLVAKIETPKAVERIHEIIHRCDGVMVARGDLGISMPIERIPVIQKQIIRLAREHRSFVITATQMLESMTHSVRPTRAEATDVANAVYDGTDAVMLSGETAIGDHPALVVRTMCRILRVTEPEVELATLLRLDGSVDSAVARAAKDLARELEAAAILAPLSSGSTAIRISRQRTSMPLIVGTTSDTGARRLRFYQGVFPVQLDSALGLRGSTERLLAIAVERGYVREGDRVVLAGGLPVEKSGTTNFLRAHTVGDEI